MSVWRYPKPPTLAELSRYDHAVIEASAGTGKTYTLEHLVIELLIEADCALDQILVVTFTEKAAAELRARLRQKIVAILDHRDPLETGGCGWTIDAGARARLADALLSFDTATISTIHAFCQRMLAESSFLTGRLFEEKLVDARTAFGRAFLEVVRSELARDPAHLSYLEAWLEESSLDNLERLLFDCAQRRGSLWPELRLAEISGVIDHLLKIDLRPVGLKPLLARTSLHGRTVQAILDRVTNLRRMLVRFERDRNLARLLMELTREESTKSGGFLSYVCDRLRTTELPRGKLTQLAEAIEKLWELRVPFPSVMAQRFLPPVLARLEVEKARAGQFDFQDMLSLLRDALNGPTGAILTSTVRRRFRYALIDEFQDTDEVQWDIFKKLFLDSDRENVLFVIGDPKQAIYGFRGADVHTYLTARDEIVRRGGKVVPLTENFRSTPPMIAALNHIFDQSSPRPFFTGRIRYDHPVVPGLAEGTVLEQDGQPQKPVHLFSVLPAEDSLRGRLVKNTLGARMASEVKALLEKKTELVSPNGTRRRLEASDIFVLTRSGREGLEVAEHLRSFGVPYAFYKQDGLFQTKEAADVRDLLVAICEPHRRSHRLRAWQGPFFEVPLDALTHCHDLPGAHPLTRRLLDWSALAQAKGYQRFFTDILRESGIVEREIFCGDSERELTNYLHIFEVLLEHASRTRATLPELVHQLDAYIEGRQFPEGEDGNVQRLESERRSVQIMTMHKTKGLEAQVVFLYGGFEGISGHTHIFHHDGVRRLYVGNAPPPEVRRESEEEDQRLLYVAATRAKAKLYLPYFGLTADGEERIFGRLNGSYAVLNQALDRLVHPSPPSTDATEWFEIEDVVARSRPPRTTADEDTVGRMAMWTIPPAIIDAPHQSDDAEIERLRRTHAGPTITSYSRIKAMKGGYQAPLVVRDAAELDVEVAADVDAPIPELGQGEANLPGGPAAGRFLHELLEKLPLETVSSAPSFEDWCLLPAVHSISTEIARRYDRAPPHLAHALRMSFVALTKPLRLGDAVLSGGIAQAESLAREMEFLYPLPEPSQASLEARHPHERRSGTRGFIKGFIDLVFRYSGKTYVIDWKSDLLPDYSPKALDEHVRKNYQLQAELYTLAIVKHLGLTDQHAFDRAFGGTAYLFVRGMANADDAATGVYFSRSNWDAVLTSDRDLASLEADR